MSRLSSLTLALALVSSTSLHAAITVEPMRLPTTRASSTPFLSRGLNDSLLLSWTETISEGRHAIKFSRLKGDVWSAPVTIVDRNDLFVNWADLPGIVETSDGTLFAWWLQRSGKSTYAYHVMLSTSSDHGKKWRTAVPIHGDRSDTEHGFVSVVPAGADRVTVIWLDGRSMAGGDGHHADHGTMQLRQRSVDKALKMTPEELLDGRVCDCCQTAATLTPAGPVFAYRDRSDDEVRDISIIRRTAAGSTKPQRVHNDNWQISGCPVNGPQLDALGNAVVISWFSGAQNRNQVHAAFSADAGARFSRPVTVATGSAAGRVETTMLDAKRALVFWMEKSGDGGELRVRLVTPTSAGEVRPVARVDGTRGSGFPRAAKVGRSVFVAWTDSAEKRIRAARVVAE